jgi:hypothetical protein
VIGSDFDALLELGYVWIGVSSWGSEQKPDRDQAPGCPSPLWVRPTLLPLSIPPNVEEQIDLLRCSHSR